MMDDLRLGRGFMVVFFYFFNFSLPLVWLAASLGIIGLRFLCCVGVGRVCINTFFNFFSLLKFIPPLYVV
jgi:hypothetical protein